MHINIKINLIREPAGNAALAEFALRVVVGIKLVGIKRNVRQRHSLLEDCFLENVLRVEFDHQHWPIVAQDAFALNNPTILMGGTNDGMRTQHQIHVEETEA